MYINVLLYVTVLQYVLMFWREILKLVQYYCTVLVRVPVQYCLAHKLYSIHTPLYCILCTVCITCETCIIPSRQHLKKQQKIDHSNSTGYTEGCLRSPSSLKSDICSASAVPITSLLSKLTTTNHISTPTVSCLVTSPHSLHFFFFRSSPVLHPFFNTHSPLTRHSLATHSPTPDSSPRLCFPQRQEREANKQRNPPSLPRILTTVDQPTEHVLASCCQKISPIFPRTFSLTSFSNSLTFGIHASHRKSVRPGMLQRFPRNAGHAFVQWILLLADVSSRKPIAPIR